MKVNDSDMCMRWNSEAWSIQDISAVRYHRWIQIKEEANNDRDEFLTFKKKRGWRFRDRRIQLKEWREEQRDVDQMVNVPQNRSIMIMSSVYNFKMRGEIRATKGDKRRRLGRAMWREWKKMRAEVRRLTRFERFTKMCEREPCIWFSHWSWASGEI